MEVWEPVTVGHKHSFSNSRARRQVTTRLIEAAARNSGQTTLVVPSDEESGKFDEGETRARQKKPAPKVSAIASAAGASGQVEDMRELENDVKKIETGAVQQRIRLYTRPSLDCK